MRTNAERFISSAAPRLVRGSDGIWVGEGVEKLQYPEGAHEIYANIEDNSYWFRHRSACIISVVKQFPPDGPILDVGGGNGIVSMALREAGFNPIVVEPGPRGARMAHERDLPVIWASLQGAKVKGEAASAIAMFDVLEHIDAEQEVLREVYRVLKAGGLFYITVPAFNWLWSKEDEAVGHARRYTVKTLEESLSNAGLEILRASYLFAPLVPAIFAGRTLPALVGISPRSRRNPECDHRLPRGVLGYLLEQMLARERRLFDAGSSVSIGSSILAVAQRQ